MLFLIQIIDFFLVLCSNPFTWFVLPNSFIWTESCLQKPLVQKLSLKPSIYVKVSRDIEKFFIQYATGLTSLNLLRLISQKKKKNIFAS